MFQNTFFIPLIMVLSLVWKITDVRLTFVLSKSFVTIITCFFARVSIDAEMAERVQ